MKQIVFRTKSKIMTLSILFSILLVAIFLALEYKSYKNEFDTKVISIKKNISKSYTYEIENLAKFYNTRIKCNINSKELLNSFEKKDRVALYNIVKKRYDALKDENKYLGVMHFHSKENRSILRVHNHRKYGDDLSSFRTIVTETNRYLKNYFGLETGIYGIYYRTINPIFNDKLKHIGSMEFGVELKYITDQLQQYHPNDKYAFLINKDVLNSYKGIENNIEFSDKYLLEDNENFFRRVYDNSDLTNSYILKELDKKLYLLTYAVTVKNYLEEDIGYILSATDVTHIKDRFYTQIIHTVLLVFIFLVASLVMLSFGFESYSKRAYKLRKKLKENSAELDRNTKLLESYTIYSQTDLKGNITYASDAFCKVSGYTKDELIGKNHNLVKTDDGISTEKYNELLSLLKAGQYWEGELKNQRKDGSYYWVKAYIRPVFDSSKKIVGYSAIRQDITEEKESEN